jgi:hypothetical protein
MRRGTTFIFGMIVGGLLLYTALSYHLIHAKDGLHLVPKVESSLAATYVDIRSFGPADWIDHIEIAQAVQASGQGGLMETAAVDSLRTGIDRLLEPRQR